MRISVKHRLYFILFTCVWVSHVVSNQPGSTCAELQVAGNPGSDPVIVEVSNDIDVNISVALKTEACRYSPKWFKVKVSASETGRRAPLCTIVFQGQRCNATSSSLTCRCSLAKQNVFLIYQKVIRPQINILEWTDSDKIPAQRERTVAFRFSAPTRETSLPTITIAVASGLSVLIIIVTIIICLVRRRRDGQRADDDVSQRQENEEEHHYEGFNFQPAKN